MNKNLIIAGDSKTLDILYAALCEYKLQLSLQRRTEYVSSHLEVISSILEDIENLSLPAV